LSGSGTRIKILEAGAHGIPVVSTYKGAAGLGLQDGVHGWLTESDPKQFASACIEAAQNASECDSRGRNLMAHVERHFERRKTVSQIVELFDQTIKGTSALSDA
jgi:polysaccharide biosynthesis protein PslH